MGLSLAGAVHDQGFNCATGMHEGFDACRGTLEPMYPRDSSVLTADNLVTCLTDYIFSALAAEARK